MSKFKMFMPTLIGAALISAAAMAAGPGSGTPPGIVSQTTNVPTYHGAIIGTGFAAAGDIYCFTPSATKLTKLKMIQISAVATAAIVGDISLELRSTVDTSGTPQAVTIGKNDPGNDAATASASGYSAAPTPGTLISRVWSHKLEASTQGAGAVAGDVTMDFSNWSDQALTFRPGVSGNPAQACVVASAFGAGAAFNIRHEHTEEP